MSKVIVSVCGETALLERQRDMSALEEREDLTGMPDLSLRHLCEDHNVIWVYKSVLSFDVCQNDIHDLMKCSRDVL